MKTVQGPALHTTTDTCKGDGICVEVCPQQVLEVHDKRARTRPEHAARCFSCGACVAVCPNGALSLEGMPASDFPPIRREAVAYPDLLAFLRARRSVRTFKDKPVDEELIRKVLEAAATAPMGFPPHTTEVLVVSTADERRALFDGVRASYEEMLKLYDNPIGRGLLRLAAGAENFHAIDGHVADVVRDANERFRVRGEDRYTYHAPVVLIFHADKMAVAFRANAYIVATYAMLAAHALGLGATMLDIVAPVVNRSNEMKLRLGIPKQSEAVVTLVMGHPRYKFAKEIRRELKSVRFL